MRVLLLLGSDLVLLQYGVLACRACRKCVLRGRAWPVLYSNQVHDTHTHTGGGKPGSSKERKLVNDFREAPSRSQPNALEFMNVNSGVTLRQVRVCLCICVCVCAHVTDSKEGT